MDRAKTYRTRQQKAILESMKQCKQHYVTVHQIAQQLEIRGESVGLTTIYRQLERLEKEGIVQKIILDGNSGACYQMVKNTHDEGQFLLKCEDCGNIIPMGCSHLGELYDHVRAEHQFQVNPYRTMFYGMCEQCLKEKKK
jgi:Fur family ferric uptake transcriptional regulator